MTRRRRNWLVVAFLTAASAIAGGLGYHRAQVALDAGARLAPAVLDAVQPPTPAPSPVPLHTSAPGPAS